MKTRPSMFRLSKNPPTASTIRKLGAVVLLSSSMLIPASASDFPGYECINVSEAASGGPEPQSYEYDLKSGKSGTLNFEYDLYTIPDYVRVTLTMAGKPNVVILDEMNSGKKQIAISVPAGRNRKLKIEMNPNGGLSGTAWVYNLRVLAENEIQLVAQSPKKNELNNQAYYEGLGGAKFLNQVRSGTILIAPDEFSRKSVSLEASATVWVPEGAKVLRVMVPENVMAILDKGCPPDPYGRFSDAVRSSRGEKQNWVIYPITEAGKYGITLIDFRGKSEKPVEIYADVVMGGSWARASRHTSSIDTDHFVAGFEWHGIDQDNLNAYPLWFVSHGFTDGPSSMLTTGDAIANYFKIPRGNIVYVNWSQGADVPNFSYSSPLQTIKIARNIQPAASALIGLLPSKAVSYNHNWVGHSFGTWLGFELHKTSRAQFGRFIALDPANSLAPGYPSEAIRFDEASVDGALAIVASSSNRPFPSYGSERLASTALTSIAFDTNETVSIGINIHRSPQFLFESILKNEISFPSFPELSDTILPSNNIPSQLVSSFTLRRGSWKLNPNWVDIVPFKAPIDSILSVLHRAFILLPNRGINPPLPNRGIWLRNAGAEFFFNGVIDSDGRPSINSVRYHHVLTGRSITLSEK